MCFHKYKSGYKCWYNVHKNGHELSLCIHMSCSKLGELNHVHNIDI